MKSFPDLLVRLNSDDPAVRSSAFEHLQELSPILEQLSFNQKHKGNYYTATQFKDLDPPTCQILEQAFGYF